MDTVYEQTLELSNSDVFYTNNAKDALFVNSGAVHVYIVPWTDDRPGRKVLLCEIPALKMIPSFFHRDVNNMAWCFAIIPKENTVITIKKDSVTNVLCKKFLTSCNIHTYDIEGFHASLTEFYNQELLKDDIYIMRGEKSHPEVRAASYEVIKGAFREEQIPNPSENLEYAALSYLCAKKSIPIISLERLYAECGKRASVQDIARASGFICRKIILDANWYKSDIGFLLGTIEGSPVACFKDTWGRYQIFDPVDNTVRKVTADIAGHISPEAYGIGRTLPSRSLSFRDIALFCLKGISVGDVFVTVLLGLLCSLIGVLLPTLNQIVYDEYISLGNIGQLSQICILIASFMLGNLFISVTKNLAGFRIESHVCYEIQNAVYERVFHLPESFFRQYDSADLARRIISISEIAGKFVHAAVITGITTILSIVYLLRMGSYSNQMTGIAVGMYLCYGIVLLLISILSMKYEKDIAECDGEASSRLYQYLNAIDKIRLAGVEDRAIYSYLQPFSAGQSAEIKKNRYISAAEVLSSVVSVIFSMVFYIVMINGKLDLTVGSFLAFSSAFGIFTGTFQQFLLECIDLYRGRDQMKRVKAIFLTSPEDDEAKELPGELTGVIKVDHVTFSYDKNSKNVLNNLNISVKAGEYIGIVGSSGCGKSTLLKLLLGFETPSSGTILYDGKDLTVLDKNALRKQLGVVLQNGKLISGSIYDNITITRPGASMQEVNSVIDAVGLRDDINQMPMGIHTVLSETSSTISGGQQQRILIARAIMGNPAILIFDEATSALDNLTQAAVCSNLDKMKITRIVVAHRLSTVKNCDRILVMNNGIIAEEGNYDSLMANKGLFYELASRQIAE